MINRAVLVNMVPPMPVLLPRGQYVILEVKGEKGTLEVKSKLY